MSYPTIGTILFGIWAIATPNNEASIALAILSIGCWINKSLEELTETRTRPTQ